MTRFEKKVDCFIWTIILILPILIYFICYFNSSNFVSFSDFMLDFRFDFIYNIFSEIFVDEFVFSDVLVNLISYMASVEIIHLFFDFVVFLPRFAHKFLSRCYHEK